MEPVNTPTGIGWRSTKIGDRIVFHISELGIAISWIFLIACGTFSIVFGLMVTNGGVWTGLWILCTLRFIWWLRPAKPSFRYFEIGIDDRSVTLNPEGKRDHLGPSAPIITIARDEVALVWIGRTRNSEGTDYFDYSVSLLDKGGRRFELAEFSFSEAYDVGIWLGRFLEKPTLRQRWQWDLPAYPPITEMDLTEVMQRGDVLYAPSDRKTLSTDDLGADGGMRIDGSGAEGRHNVLTRQIRANLIETGRCWRRIRLTGPVDGWVELMVLRPVGRAVVSVHGLTIGSVADISPREGHHILRFELDIGGQVADVRIEAVMHWAGIGEIRLFLGDVLAYSEVGGRDEVIHNTLPLAAAGTFLEGALPKPSSDPNCRDDHELPRPGSNPEEDAVRSQGPSEVDANYPKKPST